MKFSISPRPAGDVVVILKDGRQIDISRLSAGNALDKLVAAGVTLKDIAATIHYCSVKGLPR